MVEQETKEFIKEKIERLPLIDAAAYEILALLNNSQSNYEKVIENLSPDITALFLTMANKAYNGKIVRSVNYAVTLLGYKAMRQILITSFLLDHFIKHLGLKHFSFDRFQKQSHFCAAVSRVLAQSMDYKNTEDLFTVAMLYNLGKLIIVVYFSDEHRKIIALKKTEKILTSDAEQRILGVTHAEIGAYALEQFNIPKDICSAVRYHNRKDRIVPLESDFQIEVISRAAASIVHYFLLPDEDQLHRITVQLTQTATDFREKFKNALTPGMRPDDYQKTFLDFIEKANGMMMDGLKDICQLKTEGGTG
jgi:HD-like signal output (HDOD) protein